MADLQINGLLFDGCVDRDEELRVEFNDERMHIDKQHAIAIIGHLKAVFSIDESESISQPESDN